MTLLGPDGQPISSREPFAHMELREANRECRHEQDEVFDQCPRCKFKVALHCSTCKIQVTGCACTEIERFGQDEGLRRLYEQFGEGVAKDYVKNAGLVLPTGFKFE